MHKASTWSWRLAGGKNTSQPKWKGVVVAAKATVMDNHAQPGQVLGKIHWDDSFVRELPGERVEEGQDLTRPRTVKQALWSPAVLTPPGADAGQGTAGDARRGPRTICVSHDVAEMVGADPKSLEDEEEKTKLAECLVGSRPLPAGAVPYAACYGGHQFGNWAGQLGDGRAITLGESVTSEGKRYELQVKGPGKTAYSRMADGRAVLRSSIREFLMSEAMHALGIPTTRALALVDTGADVMRDIMYSGDPRWEPGAVVCRVAPTWIRFGTFQLPASRGELDLVKMVADYLVKYHMKEFANLPREEKYKAMLDEIVKRTADLVVGWCSVGFTHGVLNTDNMSVLGLTLDYGPYGTVEEFDPSFTPNTTDLPGRRYCFGNQPDIALWNIARMAEAWVQADLLTLEQAKESVSAYPDMFRTLYDEHFAKKLGLKKMYSPEILDELTLLMAEDKADYNCTFRSLSRVDMSADTSEPSTLLQPLLDGGALLPSQLDEQRKSKWAEFLLKYKELARQEGEEFLAKRAACMDAVNPMYVLRNHLLQTAIDRAEEGDYSEVHKLFALCQRPFEEQEGIEERYARRAPSGTKKIGVTMLSCSS